MKMQGSKTKIEVSPQEYSDLEKIISREGCRDSRYEASNLSETWVHKKVESNS